jgi:hypothetical protein
LVRKKNAGQVPFPVSEPLLGTDSTAQFKIRTEEYWLHRVDYTVTADTLEEGMQQILRGEVAYDDAEVIEGADEVELVCKVDGKDVPESESDKLLAEHKTRRRWQGNNTGQQQT